MKTTILLIILCFFSSNVMANTNPIDHLNTAMETIYLNNVKVTYTKAKTSAVPNLLSIYLDKNQLLPSYQHKMYVYEMRDANIYQDKLTIMFKTRNSYQILVLNHKTGQVIDHFWAFFSSISPDGRFIVYKRWRSRNETSVHGMPIGITLIYDVTKSPAENRMSKHLKHLQQRPPSISNYSWYAGIPVYPLGDYNQPEYGWSTGIISTAAVHDQYTWYQNNAFIFAVVPQKGMTKLVNAVYNKKQKKFVVKTYKAVAKDFITSQTQDGYLPIKWVEKTGDQLKLFTDDSIIRLNGLNQLERIE